MSIPRFFMKVISWEMLVCGWVTANKKARPRRVALQLIAIFLLYQAEIGNYDMVFKFILVIIYLTDYEFLLSLSAHGNTQRHFNRQSSSFQRLRQLPQVYDCGSLGLMEVVRCPYCNSEKVTYLAKAKLYRCYGDHPKQKFSLKIGTVFEDSPIPLEKWLPAVLACRELQEWNL